MAGERAEERGKCPRCGRMTCRSETTGRIREAAERIIGRFREHLAPFCQDDAEAELQTKLPIPRDLLCSIADELMAFHRKCP